MDTSVLFTSIHNSWIVSAGNLQKLCLLTRYSINAINDYAYKHTGPRNLHQGRQPKILTGIPFILSFSFRYVSQAVSERAKSPGVCLSRNLCSLVLYESFVLLRVEEKNNPFIFSAVPFRFYSNCYRDRGCYKEEYQCKQGVKCAVPPNAVNWSDDSEERGRQHNLQF